MTKAADIMTPEVATISSAATVAEAVKLMKFKQLHSLIVDPRNEEDAYGIITDTDVIQKVVAFGKDPKTVKVYEIMTKPCIVVNPDLAIEYVARLFLLSGIDRAPVIRGDLLGIISATDILQKGDFLNKPRVVVLENALKKAIAEAREVSAANASDSDAVNKAWNFVNEIEAELAFCKDEVPAQSAYEQFGSVPEAAPALA